MKVNIKADLEQLSTRQLEEILQQEVSKQQPDENVVLAIMKILEEREGADPVVIDEPVRAAWDRYREGNAADQEKAAKRKRLLTTKVAAIAASIAILIMTVPQAVGARSVFEIIAQWTERIFSFGDEPEEEYVFRTDHPGLQQVYDAVAGTGFDKPVVPTWLPEEYELVTIGTANIAKKTKVNAVFRAADSEVVITIFVYRTEFSDAYLMDKSDFVIVEHNGVNHYVVSNDGSLTAIWTQDRAECSISMVGREDILQKILKSIYTVEDQQ